MSLNFQDEANLYWKFSEFSMKNEDNIEVEALEHLMHTIKASSRSTIDLPLQALFILGGNI
jgi:hypothetical protein